MKIVMTADWQVRRTRPLCRLDKNWMATMERKIKFVLSCGDVILIAGDIFETNPASNYITGWLAKLIRESGKRVFAIFGQHDLMYHSLERKEDTNLDVLAKAGVIEIIEDCKQFMNVYVYGMHWGQEEFPKVKDAGAVNILMVHKLLVDEPKVYGGENAATFLSKAKPFDIVLAGDNHKTFIIPDRTAKRCLYSPGSLLRLRADQIDHKPEILILDTKTNTFERKKIPILSNVITRKHIQEADEENENIIKLLDELEEQGKLTIDFEPNLHIYFEEEKTPREIQDIIIESLAVRQERRSQ